MHLQRTCRTETSPTCTDEVDEMSSMLSNSVSGPAPCSPCRRENESQLSASSVRQFVIKNTVPTRTICQNAANLFFVHRFYKRHLSRNVAQRSC